MERKKPLAERPNGAVDQVQLWQHTTGNAPISGTGTELKPIWKQPEHERMSTFAWRQIKVELVSFLMQQKNLPLIFVQAQIKIKLMKLSVDETNQIKNMSKSKSSFSICFSFQLIIISIIIAKKSLILQSTSSCWSSAGHPTLPLSSAWGANERKLDSGCKLNIHANVRQQM